MQHGAVVRSRSPATANHSTATTSVTSGICSFRWRSTPIFNVIIAPAHPRQAPCSLTETTPVASSTPTNSISPPCPCSIGRIVSMTPRTCSPIPSGTFVSSLINVPSTTNVRAFVRAARRRYGIITPASHLTTHIPPYCRIQTSTRESSHHYRVQSQHAQAVRICQVDGAAAAQGTMSPAPPPSVAKSPMRTICQAHRADPFCPSSHRCSPLSGLHPARRPGITNRNQQVVGLTSWRPYIYGPLDKQPPGC